MINIQSIKINKWTRTHDHIYDHYRAGENDHLTLSSQRSGLIEPIIVLKQSCKYVLLDGGKRLSAAKSSGWYEIDAVALDRRDSEQWVYNRVTELVDNQELTLSDVSMYIGLLEAIHKGMSHAKNQECSFSQSEWRDKILSVFKMNSKKLQKSIYVARNGSPELISNVDQGILDLRRAFKEVRKQKETLDAIDTFDVIDTIDALDTQQYIAEPQSTVDLDAGQNADQNADQNAGQNYDDTQTKKRQRCERKVLTAAETRIVELEGRVQREYYRANIAEGNLRDIQESHHNQIYHRDGIIHSLRVKVRELQAEMSELRSALYNGAEAHHED